MKLYSAPMPAPNPRRVRIFLAEKGLAVTEEFLDFAKREHKGETHRRRNSLGQVPTLELEDQTTISESVAICRYFEALQPQPPMFGRTPFEQAEVEMWTRRVEFVLTQPVGNFWRHAHPRTSALLTQYKDFGESNREGWNRAVAWLDRELEGRSFIAGDSFTIADVCALTTVDFAAWIGLPVAPELARLSDWRAKVSARPSAKA